MSFLTRPRLAQLLFLLPFFLCSSSCAGPEEDVGAAAAGGPESDGALVPPVITEVLDDIALVEEKVMSLAQEFTEQQYAWRPSDGVRSSAQVLMHVAAINYYFPTAAGVTPPVSTGIAIEDPATTVPAYEGSLTSKAPILAELQASFDHLRAAMESTRTGDLDRQVEVFGEPLSVRFLWVGQAGHLHEHLGQLIAYARVNGVQPPWSQ